MIFQRINRSNAERVFVVMKANEGSIAADDVVQLELTAASVDGVNIVQPNTSEMNAVVGIADAAIADGAYGLVQVYGYRSTSRVRLSGSTRALGQLGVPIAGSDSLGFIANVIPASGFLPAFVLLETLNSSTGATNTGSVKVFIRAM